MTHTLMGRYVVIGATAILLAGCGQPPSTLMTPSMLPVSADPLPARSDERCMNVSFEGSAALEVIEVGPGVFTRDLKAVVPAKRVARRAGMTAFQPPKTTRDTRLAKAGRASVGGESPLGRLASSNRGWKLNHRDVTPRTVVACFHQRHGRVIFPEQPLEAENT